MREINERKAGITMLIIRAFLTNTKPATALHILCDSSIKTPQDLIKRDPYFAQFKPIIIK